MKQPQNSVTDLDDGFDTNSLSTIDETINSSTNSIITEIYKYDAVENDDANDKTEAEIDNSIDVLVTQMDSTKSQSGTKHQSRTNNEVTDLIEKQIPVKFSFHRAISEFY